MSFKIFRVTAAAGIIFTAFACQPHKRAGDAPMTRPVTPSGASAAATEPSPAIPDITLKPEIVPTRAR